MDMVFAMIIIIIVIVIIIVIIIIIMSGTYPIYGKLQQHQPKEKTYLKKKKKQEHVVGPMNKM